ncbi:MAG: hypothetical protein ACOH2V_14005 [Candidatus Saccharimonadaceae bacterium]
MSSTSETGHASNVANFNTLINIASAYGAAYNPSREPIKIVAMQAIAVGAKEAVDAVNAAQPAYSNAVAARELAFEPLSSLNTRIINALKASGAPQQVIANALTLSRKIQGKRATPKLTGEQKAALTADGKPAKEISASQLSFDNRIANFDKLIQYLATVPEYTPNEAELKTTALTTMLNDLTAKNAAAVASTIPLSNARIARNQFLYKTDTGLVDIAMNVKAYIKSVFGASSAQFKQVSALKFTSVKI